MRNEPKLRKNATVRSFVKCHKLLTFFMEFLVVTAHSGNSLADHLASMEFLYVHPEYLTHVKCNSLKEYASSIVHVSSQIEAEDASRKVRALGYCKNAGTIIFRHIRSTLTATLHYSSDLLCDAQVRATSAGRFLMLSRITNIEWQKNDGAARWMGHLEAKLSLGMQCKVVSRDGLECLAIRSSEIPPASDSVKNSMKAMKCCFGVNVAYEMQGTHRSAIIVRSLLTTYRHIAHEGYWHILSCGGNVNSIAVLETSSQLCDWMGCNNDGHFCRKMFVENVAQNNMRQQFPRIVEATIGQEIEFNVDLQANGVTERVGALAVKFREVIAIVLKRSHSTN